MNLGGKIAELRNAQNISQQELANALFVSRDLVSKWENGKSRPDYATIERIAEVLNVSANEIADRNDIVFRELSECIPDGADIPGRELKSLTESFLASLSENEAGIFVRRYYYLRSAEEIAGDYGIRSNHVRSILSKTRVKFKRYLKERAS
ncbi:MAG: helix-turn-helix transcriptional regulator [Clostridia bacterium]|nr:helix-turn-helix transcriptional regulator [Clostridia bacterium]